MMGRWKRPIYGVGAVPPSENQQRCVMFVCAKRDGEVTPVGTAFLVGIPGEHGAWFTYFVTAGHVVRGDSPRWIRLRRWDGSPPENLDVDEWVHHPTADIAATPCDFDTAEYVANYQEETYFCDKFPAGAVINLGERAYFMGLLSDVETMADRAVPMMRAAVIGSMYAEDIPVRDRYPDGTEYTRREPRALLIDTYSRSGFSGSPVYVDHGYVNMQGVSLEGVSERAIAVQLTSFSALFGVLVGHFGSQRDNAGVAIVVPIDALRELLDDERLVEWRVRKGQQMAERKKKREDETAATLDVVAEPSEFANFEELTRKLMQVPKSEVDKKRDDDQA